MVNPLARVLSFLLLFSACSLAQARLVEAEGNAVITDAGIGAARQTAMQDALRQAAIQSGAQVTTSSVLSESVVVSDNVKIRATGVVKDVVVLDEWRNDDDDIYHVMIRAYVEEDTSGEMQKSLDSRYRRKVAVTQFAVSDRSQIVDMPGIEAALPQELMRRLTLDQKIIGVDGTQYLIPESNEPYEGLGQTPRQLIVQLADRLGAQFILTGTIRDMGMTKHPLWVQLRHVELETQLWDGISGTIISQERVNASVRQGLPFIFPTTSPVLTDKFFAAPIGRQINLLLNELVTAISGSVHRLPFMARVIKSEGSTIYFDVGAISQIKVGDVFMAYKLAAEPLLDGNKQLFFGYEETPASSIVIKKVQPRFAVGVLEGGNTRLYAGDVIRFQW
ncbi:MAG: flagellar assembly protein FlgT [Gammaproteobacteria bacterium]|nr:flagellar assembly protein FlgT [Gammaproteobacteria bacterium]